MNQNQSHRSQQNGVFWDIVWSVTLIVIIIVILLRIFVFQQVNVVGPSMQPNYFNDEQLLVNEIDKNMQRGQVVAVYEDKEVAADANYFTRFTARFFLKRVIGLPGEEIEVVGDTVIVYNDEYPDGVALQEPYLSADVKLIEQQNNSYHSRTLVPDDHYFLLGDNRSDSLDSRVRGAFPAYSIFGKETAKYLPLNKFRVFELPTYSYTNIDDELSSLRTQLEGEYQEER